MLRHGFHPPEAQQRGSIQIARSVHRQGRTPEDGKEGTLLYIKSTLTQGPSCDVYGYRSLHPTFPDETTTNQFFNELQFEAYRQLGYDLGRQFLTANEEWKWTNTVKQIPWNQNRTSPIPGCAM
jgi:hypothetical protein